MLMSIETYIFDLDGTLLDTLEDIANACNAALAAAGYPTHAVNSYRGFVGSGMEALVRRCLPPELAASISAPALAALVDNTRAAYNAAWNICTRPYPGVVDMLQRLTAQGLALAVLSNKPHAWTVEMVQYYFPSIPFREIRGAMPNVPHKPDPTAALAIAQALSVAPSCCAFVGDSDIDILTAKAAGMLPIGVSWGFRGEAELRAAGAASIAHTGKDIPL